jgi:hypothetical protein
MARFMQGRRGECEGNLKRVDYPWNKVWKDWTITGRRYQVFDVVLSFRVFFDATLCPWISGS